MLIYINHETLKLGYMNWRCIFCYCNMQIGSKKSSTSSSNH